MEARYGNLVSIGTEKGLSLSFLAASKCIASVIILGSGIVKDGEERIGGRVRWWPNSSKMSCVYSRGPCTPVMGVNATLDPDMAQGSLKVKKN